jgi:hypothetical protein
MRSMAIVAMLSMTFSAAALEKMVLVDAEQVWTGSASQVGNVSARFALSGALATDVALTSIIRARFFVQISCIPITLSNLLCLRHQGGSMLALH